MLQPLITRVPPYIRIFQTRAAFRAAFGYEAPPFDFTLPVKDWADTRQNLDPEEEIAYTGVRYLPNGEPDYDASRVVSLATFRLFPEIAQGVNLLPEPVPPQSALSERQVRMMQRRRPWPLALNPGERVILAPGIGTIPVIDDGQTQPTAGPAELSEILTILRRIAAKVGA